MRSNKFHDALRRPAFDLADQRGNNPHGTREQAEAEGRRLNGYRYETVSQVERALDARARQPARPMGEVPPPAPPPGGGGSGGGGGGGGNGLFWLLAAGAGIALLSALSSSSRDDDEQDDGDGDGDGDDLPLRENPTPAPAVAPSSITVNLSMPNAAPYTTSVPLPNPAPVPSSEPVQVTVPIVPVVMPPLDPAPALAPPAAILANPEKKRRRSKVAG